MNWQSRKYLITENDMSERKKEARPCNAPEFVPTTEQLLELLQLFLESKPRELKLYAGKKYSHSEKRR